MNSMEDRDISVIFTNVPDTAKLVKLCRDQMPFTIVKVHEQRNLVCIVFSGYTSDDPDGYFSSFVDYFGYPDVITRVADGNIFS